MKKLDRQILDLVRERPVMTTVGLACVKTGKEIPEVTAAVGRLMKAGHLVQRQIRPGLHLELATGAPKPTKPTKPTKPKPTKPKPQLGEERDQEDAPRDALRLLVLLRDLPVVFGFAAWRWGLL